MESNRNYINQNYAIYIMYILITTVGVYSSIYIFVNSYIQKTRILISLANSTALSLYGIYSHIYINQNEENTALADYIWGYFFFDMFIGHFYDRTKFNLLTGYIHHTIYLGLVTYIRITKQTYLIYPFLHFEIPTAILDINKIYPNKNFNNAFGISFFIFRLAYNIYIIPFIYSISIYYSLVTILMLCVHGYWFSIWLRRFNSTPRIKAATQINSIINV